MLIKAQIVENGVARDIIIDPNKHWVAIRFTAHELMVLSTFREDEVMILAPMSTLKGMPQVVSNWAREWPTQFFSGHRPPAGGLLLPNGAKIDQDT